MTNQTEKERIEKEVKLIIAGLLPTDKVVATEKRLTELIIEQSALRAKPLIEALKSAESALVKLLAHGGEWNTELNQVRNALKSDKQNYGERDDCCVSCTILWRGWFRNKHKYGCCCKHFRNGRLANSSSKQDKGGGV